MIFWKIDESSLQRAVKEIESGVRRDALWAESFIKCNGDEQKAKAMYLKMLTSKIMNEDAERAYNDSRKENEEKSLREELERKTAVSDFQKNISEMDRNKVLKIIDLINTKKASFEDLDFLAKKIGAEIKVRSFLLGYTLIWHGLLIKFSSLQDLGLWFVKSLSKRQDK